MLRARGTLGSDLLLLTEETALRTLLRPEEEDSRAMDDPLDGLRSPDDFVYKVTYIHVLHLTCQSSYCKLRLSK